MSAKPNADAVRKNRGPGGPIEKAWAGSLAKRKNGAPVSLKNLVLKATNNGKTIVDLMSKIADGTLAVPRTVPTSNGQLNTYDVYPDHRDRMCAAEWLADRGFGKVKDEVSLTPGEGSTLAGMIISVSKDELPKLKEPEKPVVDV